MQKAAQQAPDVQAPGHTSENALANAASSQFAPDQRSVQNGLAPLASHETVSDNSISPNAGNSNTSSENVPLSEMMQYGKPPEHDR